MSPPPTVVVRLAPCPDLARAQAALAEAIGAARLRMQAGSSAFVRIEQPISTDVALLDWLEGFPAMPRFYWGNRGGFFALAATGIAAEAEGAGFDVIPSFLHSVSQGEGTGGMRVLGWSRFDVRGTPGPEWQPFGRVRTVLPLLELRRTASHVLLAANLPGVHEGRTADFLAKREEALDALRKGAPLEAPPAPKPPLDGHLDPGAELWQKQVERVLQEIDDGRIEKAVLARRRTHLASFDALDLLARRIRESSESYHILIEPVPFAAFIAATPERLYYRDGQRIETEALAGTRARSESARADAELVRELLASTKDRHEHDIVSREIVRRLTPLCEGVVLPPPPVVRTLVHLHHLRTPLTGKLKSDVDDAQVLKALHPTPAVCGMPTGVALHLLRQIEKFDRGLYSGPVGCFGPADAEVAVGIRSALVRRDAVQLLAGAGIVAGSEPAREWQETVDKMKGLERLLESDEPT